MPLLLKFHGALDEVTGSCHFFKIKASGNIYAVDCGATQGDDVADQAANPRNLPPDCKVDMLSGILLTHAHGDHISHLPRWFKAGFNGSIICTAETAKLAEISLKDGRRIEGDKNGKDKGYDYVDDTSFDRTIDALKDATLVTPGRKQTLENNVTIEAAMTSHLLGCCGFRIEVEHDGRTSSVFYTGDIGPVEHADETQSLYAERQRPAMSADYIVSESTYGNRPRSKESQSGRRRLDRVCQMLRTAFRHGDDSVVFIPAFSLQRTIDVLVDVYCALHYKRDKVGLDAHEIPLIVVHSKLSQDYAEAYRDFYYAETRDGLRLFNQHAALHRISQEHHEDAYAQLDNLLPRSKNDIIARKDENLDTIETEILWGGWDGQATRPTVVICASGMTQNGPIVQYMADFLGKEHATFALCGFVPPSSAGGHLRKLFELPREERSTFAIRLPGDPKRQRLPKVFSGDEVKCGFESISEFYSGHADGASIIRYILGDKLERAADTKGIFLVHGDRSARHDLAQLILSTCGEFNVAAPKVISPMQGWGWFDCETGEGVKPASEQAAAPEHSTAPAEPMPAATAVGRDIQHGVALPDRLEIETTVIVSNAEPLEDVIATLAAAFDRAKPEIRGQSLLLKINRPGQAHSTVMLRASRIGESLLKLSAESRIMQFEHASEIAHAALDWRRVLNALKAPKELYFAGSRFFESDEEIARLVSLCQPVVFEGKQRLQPVLILQESLLGDGELEGIERLLTPSVLVAVVKKHAYDQITKGLAGPGEEGQPPPAAMYLPLIAKGGPRRVTDADGRLMLQALADLVTSDTLILNAREPQLHASGKPTTLERVTSGNPFIRLVETLIAPKAENQPKPEKTKIGFERRNLRPEMFMEHVVGQKVKSVLHYVRRKSDTNQFIFAIYRLDGCEVTGILHHTNLTGVIDETIGSEMDLWVRSVTPEEKSLSLSNIPMQLPAEAMLKLVKSQPFIAPREIADLLGSTGYVSAVCQGADESFSATKTDHPPVNAATPLDAPRAIDAYNRAVLALGLISRTNVAAPAPVKGPTYGEIARELEMPLENLVTAAAHMIGNSQSYELGITVLPPGFTPKEGTTFPAGTKDRFVAEVRALLASGWQAPKTGVGNLQPDCHSIAELARLMGIPQPTLLARLEEKGIKPEVRVVVTPDDIRKLIG